MKTQLTADILEPSQEFKKEVVRSVTSIACFVLVYFLLFLLAIALALTSAWLGVVLVVNVPKLITLGLAIGMIGFGVMVFVFVVKFLFSENKVDESDSIQITEQDQPELVRFIYSIAERTNTFKPKKIFLSTDVNACVFYNSSFWSMFLPVKKNLKIGLGLVNSVNVSEFEAILAHEFGHFSQRSMKVGSYVYQCNKVIFDMLYNNNGYVNALKKFAEGHWTVALFANLTAWVVRGIQWVLAQMYKLVNKSYMALSRQMEFHADLVAATISGNNNAISALRRIEVSAACFDITINNYNRLLEERKKVSKDAYTDHSFVMKRVAQKNNWQIKDGMLVPGDVNNSTASRINYKDQWASHPTIDEREQYLLGFELEKPVNGAPAWNLFKNPVALKQQLTSLIYRNVPGEEQQPISSTDFEGEYIMMVNDNSFPAIFKGYYDDREIEIFDTETSTTVTEPLSELLSGNNLDLPARVKTLESDIALLDAISKKQIDINSFDFDGNKYPRKQAAEVKDQLEEECRQAKAELAALDRKIYLAASNAANEANRELLGSGYDTYFSHRKQADIFFETVKNSLEFVHSTWNSEQAADVEYHISQFKEKQEQELKDCLSYWKGLQSFEKDPSYLEKLDNFTRNDYRYFADKAFMENELSDVRDLAINGWGMVQDFLFLEFKKVLELQADIVTNVSEAVKA